MISVYMGALAYLPSLVAPDLQGQISGGALGVDIIYYQAAPGIECWKPLHGISLDDSGERQYAGYTNDLQSLKDGFRLPHI